MFDFVIEKMSKLFIKDYSKDEYLRKILTTPDKDFWGGNTSLVDMLYDKTEDTTK